MRKSENSDFTKFNRIYEKTNWEEKMKNIKKITF